MSTDRRGKTTGLPGGGAVEVCVEAVEALPRNGFTKYGI